MSTDSILTHERAARAEALDRARHALGSRVVGGMPAVGADELLQVADWIVNGNTGGDLAEALTAWRDDLDSEPHPPLADRIRQSADGPARMVREDDSIGAGPYGGDA